MTGASFAFVVFVWNLNAPGWFLREDTHTAFGTRVIVPLLDDSSRVDAELVPTAAAMIYNSGFDSAANCDLAERTDVSENCLLAR